MSFEAWQRANILGAVNYLKEIGVGRTVDRRAEAVSQGLLEVLEPGRRVTRLQREAAQAAKAAAGAGQERRASRERRALNDRRRKADPQPGSERRVSTDRRQTRDRRSRA